MDIDRILVLILGGLSVLLVVAVVALSLMGHEPNLVLTASLSTCLGALFALARSPMKDK